MAGHKPRFYRCSRTTLMLTLRFAPLRFKRGQPVARPPVHCLVAAAALAPAAKEVAEPVEDRERGPRAEAAAEIMLAAAAIHLQRRDRLSQVRILRVRAT